ncbi:hypothetical protein HB830_02490 [Listeria innocua]|uniref:hypothetical protein n=1 Tax=Listeria innocua TaxID=1642 RepID=UPI0016255B2D|nr:hypothetical protein [Listeria innocua]MBC1392253.1 hypothetical protein [Listeria innocua]
MSGLKSKVLWSGVVAVIAVVILILALFNGCQPTLDADSYVSEVNSLIDKNKSGQNKWNLILGGSAFVDLCTEPYAQEFERLGQAFIDQADDFASLRVEEDPSTIVPNYATYQLYFGTYRSIGEQLQAFADAIRASNFEQALVLLDELEALNNQLPVIER